PTSNSVFATNRNKSWKVLTYISFMDKSLLFVQANDGWYNLLPTIIPIDNQEITSFYDPHWNIPKDYQEN
ncbi:12843_t:CDS:1, partial [Cetraspora pellucida]